MNFMLHKFNPKILILKMDQRSFKAKFNLNQPIFLRRTISLEKWTKYNNRRHKIRNMATRVLKKVK